MYKLSKKLKNQQCRYDNAKGNETVKNISEYKDPCKNP